MRRRLPLFLSLAVLASIVPAAPALAHAKLMSSSPSAGQTVAAPAAVTLDFDDVVQLPPRAVQVTGPGGAVAVRASRPDSKTLEGSLPRHLRAGRYAVRWRILADDGHIESGAFAFTVRAGAKQASAAASMPARGAVASSSNGDGTAAVVLTLLLSIVTITALGVGLVRLRRERAAR